MLLLKRILPWGSQSHRFKTQWTSLRCSSACLEAIRVISESNSSTNTSNRALTIQKATRVSLAPCQRCGTQWEWTTLWPWFETSTLSQLAGSILSNCWPTSSFYRVRCSTCKKPQRFSCLLTVRAASAGKPLSTPLSGSRRQRAQRTATITCPSKENAL